MNRSTIILAVLGGLLLLIGFNGCGSYNNMVTKDESVNAQWKNVEVVYQRRADLIPNIVKTVEGYANFEKSTITSVTEARAKATSIQIDPSKLDEASIKKFQEAQSALSSSLGRLLAVAENYPDLKANQNFMALQTELEGTENRIAVERRKFNEVSQDYNTYVRRFPRNIWAGLFGFSTRGYFSAEAGSEKAPEVKFDIK